VTTPPSTVSLTPARSSERVAELDVLRGVVLFGVFLLNMIDFGFDLALPEQLRALPTARLDFPLYDIAYWLVDDKSITLFAFLFGLGFHIQMERMRARGPGFEHLYLRRLWFLFVLGVAHIFLVWFWDILHAYALAGFALFALRGLPSRTLLICGLALTLLADPLDLFLFERIAANGLSDAPTAAEALAEQQLLVSGDYPGLVVHFARYTAADYLQHGTLLGLLGFALGRFMLGAWVGQRGWFQDCARYLPGFRRVLRVALPIGLVGAFVGQALEHLTSWNYTAFALHVLAQLPLAAGYAAGVVVAFHTPLGRRLLTPFAHPGRMALSNYVGQSVLCGLVFTGVGPGLALIGRIGVGEVMLISIALYAVQVLASRWWLARYRFGPLEWLWRGYTYQELPALRRAPLPVTT